MKQILLELKEINKHLSFLRKAFTKKSFRHVNQYINGLITLNKKSAKQISEASIFEKHHLAISRILTKAKFEQQKLEKRYLQKVKYLTKNQPRFLIFDDTLVEHNGKEIECTKLHKDHVSNGYVKGHQFFTALIYTPMLQLPLFPQLYYDESMTKIEMARELIEKMSSQMKISSVLFDSWYSDKALIKRCIVLEINITGAVKANRNINFKRGQWQKISAIEDDPEQLDKRIQLIPLKLQNGFKGSRKLSFIPGMI